MSHLGERLSALIDGELSHSQRERVLAHLAHCEPCRREAAALRALKQRMHALGEATADTALTDRLIAVAGLAGATRGRRRPLGRRHRLARRRPLGRRPGPGGPRRWPVRSLALAALAMTGLGVPAAAFLAGGGQQAAGPSVTPAIDMFTLQHALSTGEAPASARGMAPAPPVTAPPVTAPPVTASPAASSPATSFSPAVAAAALVRVAAASTRVAAASARPATAPGRGRRPQPAMTAAGAR